MRVFITSTPDPLEACRWSVISAIEELGHHPVSRDPAIRPGLDSISACARQVASCDLLLALIGRLRGPVPPVRVGGDGLRPWVSWEVEHAFDRGIPVVALVADEAIDGGDEATAEAAAIMADLRGELARLGSTFEDAPALRRAVRRALRGAQRAPADTELENAGLKLRPPSQPSVPPLPYPLLLPYSHPDFMAGRDHDLDELRRVLARPIPIVGLHAVSGTGKSSLLAAGLVPTLRAEGQPVVLDRHPAEPGLGTRLMNGLVEGRESGVREPDGRELVDCLRAVWLSTGGIAPVLVLDQFEDLFKGDDEAASRLGPLLAASVQRLPGIDGPVCRWLLAYRQDYHGRVVEWLQDVLAAARKRGLPGLDALPHDLSRSSRFTDWPLRPLATSTGAGDVVRAATRVFLDAIEKPLRQGHFPWRFAEGHAERLARVFGEARARRPGDPLAPELQVVLAHLLEQASAIDSEQVEVTVPDAAAELVDRALENHLRRALNAAFPPGRDSSSRIARTRALLVLRELADVHGRRDEGRSADVLEMALGEHGREVLGKLSTPSTRLVLREQRGDELVYVLAHDRLAEILVQTVDGGRAGELGIDPELLGLRRLVALQSRLFASGDREQATGVAPASFERIERHAAALLWDDERRRWWRACRRRRRLERRQLVARAMLAAILVAAVAIGTWTVADRRARHQGLLDEVAAGEPDQAFAALVQLLRQDRDPTELRRVLGQRPRPFDVFEHGLGGVPEPERAEATLRAARFAEPMVDIAPEDPVRLASLVWALDFFVGKEPALVSQAMALRERVLAPLRRRQPPPPSPADDDPAWADLAGGTFWMGAVPGDGRDGPMFAAEAPRHRVTVSPFRLMVHEVTNGDYRRLVPDHPGADDLPAVNVDWFEAYTYAAWLGGRLPTEAEWEFAAHGGCTHTFCTRDGDPAGLDAVAWWLGNSDRSARGPEPQPVRQLEPNPFGLWDLHGNVWEWSADWVDAYAAGHQLDPFGPPTNTLGLRATRSGSFRNVPDWLVASARGRAEPSPGRRTIGLRVLLPPSSDETERRGSGDR